METPILRPEDAATVDRALAELRTGNAVALPTETVYGLAADALETAAVLKIFESKKRPLFDPLIVHLPDLDWIDRVAFIEPVHSDLINKLLAEFWPGPLTIVIPRRPIVPDIVTAGLETVALRISSHPVFQQIIRQFGKPLAAPSANRFGRISPTTAGHVLAELDGRIPLIVDGGPTMHGIESTVIAFVDGKIHILRQGPVTSEELANFAAVVTVGQTANVQAPGQLASHYAPTTRLVLINDASNLVAVEGRRHGLLAWRTESTNGFVVNRKLSESGDLREAAANLFRLLRELDAEGLDLIVAEYVPDHGLGAAINDRLRRAAAK